MIDNRTNAEKIETLNGCLDEVLKWIKYSHENAKALTHVPKNDVIKLAKKFKQVQKQQYELFMMYGAKTWRTTKPPKVK